MIYCYKKVNTNIVVIIKTEINKSYKRKTIFFKNYKFGKLATFRHNIIGQIKTKILFIIYFGLDSLNFIRISYRKNHVKKII